MSPASNTAVSAATKGRTRITHFRDFWCNVSNKPPLYVLEAEKADRTDFGAGTGNCIDRNLV